MTARRNNPLSSIVVLCSICLVVSLLMTLCYQATEEHIESNRERRQQAMMLELLPDKPGVCGCLTWEEKESPYQKSRDA